MSGCIKSIQAAGGATRPRSAHLNPFPPWQVASCGEDGGLGRSEKNLVGAACYCKLAPQQLAKGRIDKQAESQERMALTSINSPRLAKNNASGMIRSTRTCKKVCIRAKLLAESSKLSDICPKQMLLFTYLSVKTDSVTGCIGG